MSRTEWQRLMGAQIFRYLLIFLITLVVAFSIAIVFYIKQGQDARVFCSAAYTSAIGKNPYNVKDLGLDFSWNYQPYLLTLFQAICPPPIDFQNLYPLYYTLLLIGGTAVWELKSDWHLGFLLAFGGFWGFGWTIITGNITAIEFFLISIVIALLNKQHWWKAGLVLAVVASFKLLTIAYLGLLLFIPNARPRRFRVLILSLFVFILTFGISLFLYPHLMRPFFEQILGLIPNQHNVWIEDGSKNNLPLAFLLTSALALIGVDFPFLLSSIAVVLILILFSFWPYRIFNLINFAKDHFTEFFCIGLLGITLALPRLKPYSFLAVIPPLFYLIRLQSKERQNLVLAISVVFPIICFFVRLFLTGDNAYLTLLFTYSPTISLLVIFIMIFHFVANPQQITHARTT
ncbi:MAG: DUF2029 domain-containing protein [Anaerolineales bacterium]|nr:DUF2029 domain-containing protein [Anaerolineales bacterium]